MLRFHHLGAAIVLVTVSMSAPWHALALPVPAPSLSVGQTRLSELPSLLGATPASALATSANAQKAEPASRLPITWALDTGLSDPATRDSIRRALHAGMPVVVIRGETHGDAETQRQIEAVFGIGADAAVLGYVQAPGRTPVAVSLDELLPDPAKRTAALQLFSRLLAEHAAAPVAPTRQPRAALLSRATGLSDADDLAMLPRLRFTTVSVNAHSGSHLSLDSEFVRDVRPQGSRLLLINKSIHSVVPHTAGVVGGGAMVLPQAYYSGHQVVPLDAAGRYVAPKLVDWFPRDDGRTQLDFREDRTTGTRFGLSLSPDAARSISSQTGATASGKLAGTFSYERSHQVTRSIAYSVRDYSVASRVMPLRRFHYNEREAGGDANFTVQTVEWNHQLASLIDNDKHYFRSNGANSAHSEAKMTPSMRGITVELTSTWEVPELGADGRIQMTSGNNIRYLVNPRHRNAPQARQYLSPAEEPRTYAMWTLPANSPFLTRYPTVRLRTRSGMGHCLFDERGTAVLKACPVLRPDDLATHAATPDQWNLDGLGRYVNRASGNCLTAVAGAGQSAREILVGACTEQSNQRWRWIADRLHSQYDGEQPGWRLRVDANGQLRVRPEDGAPVIIPTNADHALLHPWSSYPAKPQQGDYIPVLAGARPGIPQNYLNLPAVSPLERWEPVLIRQSSGE